MADTQELKTISKHMRLDILRLAHAAGNKGAHIAPSLSMVEIMAVLFCRVLRHGTDEFILSKGHGGLCYYAALYQAGLITKEQMDSFEENGGLFPGQPSRSAGNAVSYSGGSLGLGLSYAAGLAWAAKRNKTDKKIYVLLGDGEMNEGMVWEAAMFARQQRLNNLVAVVDCNGMQSDGFSKDIMQVDAEKVWGAFGWDAVLCDGHSESGLIGAFASRHAEKPAVVIAKTVKGKGVSFMENNRAWHHGILNGQQYAEAVAEVEAGYGR